MHNSINIKMKQFALSSPMKILHYIEIRQQRPFTQKKENSLKKLPVFHKGEIGRAVITQKPRKKRNLLQVDRFFKGKKKIFPKTFEFFYKPRYNDIRRYPPFPYKMRQIYRHYVKSRRLARQRFDRQKARFALKKKFAKKHNLQYIKILKKFVFWTKILRARKIYKYILVTKQALIQYYKKFSMTNYLVIQREYRKRKPVTRFEKFIIFFETRLPNMLVRIRYAKYILYANFLIFMGQIFVNGNPIVLHDFHIVVNDMIEISFRGFFRQYFKLFMFRNRDYIHKKIYGLVYKKRTRGIYYQMKKVFPTKIPTWLYWGFTRLFKTAFLYADFMKTPKNSFFLQSRKVLATILVTIPNKFADRKFSRLFTKKHMKFFSNFCTQIY